MDVTAHENSADGIQSGSYCVISGAIATSNADGFEALYGSIVKGNSAIGNGGAGLRASPFCTTALAHTAYTANAFTGNGATVIGGCIVEVGENVCDNNTTCP